MRTVSASITRVVRTMSEITAASVEQSVGIEQVSQARHADGSAHAAERGAGGGGRGGGRVAERPDRAPDAGGVGVRTGRRPRRTRRARGAVVRRRGLRAGRQRRAGGSGGGRRRRHVGARHLPVRRLALEPAARMQEARGEAVRSAARAARRPACRRERAQILGLRPDPLRAVDARALRAERRATPPVCGSTPYCSANTNARASAPGFPVARAARRPHRPDRTIRTDGRAEPVVGCAERQLGHAGCRVDERALDGLRGACERVVERGVAECGAAASHASVRCISGFCSARCRMTRIGVARRVEQRVAAVRREAVLNQRGGLFGCLARGGVARRRAYHARTRTR